MSHDFNAFPQTSESFQDGRGLDKREYMAGQALAGLAALLIDPESCVVLMDGAERTGVSVARYIGNLTVQLADATLEALNE